MFSPHAFSRAWRRLHVFASNSDWLVVLCTSIATGQSNYFGFGFTTLNWKPLYLEISLINWMRDQEFFFAEAYLYRCYFFHYLLFIPNGGLGVKIVSKTLLSREDVKKLKEVNPPYQKRWRLVHLPIILSVQNPQNAH